MHEKWHEDFNPKRFLDGINIYELIERNIVNTENIIEKPEKPCVLCSSNLGPGLRLNNGFYLCKKCFDEVAHIQYPEEYENSRRLFMMKYAAWDKARDKFVRKSRFLKAAKISCIFGFLSIALLFFWIKLIFITVLLFIFCGFFKKINTNKIKKWVQIYPIPLQPTLLHFHDPDAKLSERDKKILDIFNHWPGDPPFWSFLRDVVIMRDNNKCQVTGCPSRLNLHVHHKKPRSEGGEHTPNNLVTLCDFHHSLEPDRGHERIWTDINTRLFTFVRKHTRKNRYASGTHLVKSHLRRKELVSVYDLNEIIRTYGLSCPFCGNPKLSVEILSNKQEICVKCKTCNGVTKGPRLLAEETGPLLAEILKVTRNIGTWKPNWEILENRKTQTFEKWSKGSVLVKRKKYKRNKQNEQRNPPCPICGANMRLVRPKSIDAWQPFWGCSKYFQTGCKGKREYHNDK